MANTASIASSLCIGIVLMSISVGALCVPPSGIGPQPREDHPGVVSLVQADDLTDDQSIIGEIDESEDDQDDEDEALLRDHATCLSIVTTSRLPAPAFPPTLFRTPSDRLDRPPRS